MGLFQQVEGEAIVLVSNGVYKQVDIYKRDGYLYAKAGGGFVRLNSDGSTTKAKTRIDTMTWTGALYRDGLGRLMAESLGGAKPIEQNRQLLLTGAV